MHPNAIFRRPQDPANLQAAAARGFGTLALNAGEADQGPLLSHVPFVLFTSDGAARIDAHLVRSNPIARKLAKRGPQAAVLAVTLGDCYISPDWYQSPEQVPTWNYQAIHLRGCLELRPQEELRAVLAATSAEFEARLAPKQPWTLDKVGAETMNTLMRAIVPVRLTIDASDATYKLSQNKSRQDQQGVVDALGALTDLPAEEAGARQAIRSAMQAALSEDNDRS